MTHYVSTPVKMATCPVNGKPYTGVSRKTILHQVKRPWLLDLPDQAYFFCNDPDCDVVYFGEDAYTLSRDELRVEVGQKSHATDRTICYCFDVKSSDLESDETRRKSRTFVINQTRSASCDCEIRNPSGKCCLKNFS